MRLLILIALLVGGVVVLRRGRPAAPRELEPPDWLPDVIGAVSRLGDPGAVADVVSRRLEAALHALHAEWWRRDDDGVYRSRLGRIAGGDAVLLDGWAAAGDVWRRDHEAAAGAPDPSAILAATGADLVAPVALDGRSLGLLAVGVRRDGRRHADRDVAAVTALADHLAFVGAARRAAVELDESRRMLQQATRLSTVGTLAAELAHEIRNPLVAVQTFLQILPERLDDPEVTVDLRGVALTELQRVARLLNELLGMARASVATFAATDIESVVEQVVRFLQVSARKKDVVLERHGDRLPTGAADASRLKQALVNLVLNAIQASPAGKTVVVTTRVAADAAGRPRVDIAIRDEGPGIPADQREAIFHPFFTTKDAGTGLGLPVTRQIVTDHGGTIAVEGEPGCGATFVIRLPLAAPVVERRDQAA